MKSLGGELTEASQLEAKGRGGEDVKASQKSEERMSKIIAKSPTQLDSRRACGYLVPERLLETELLTG